jgi:hypothetical protein
MAKINAFSERVESYNKRPGVHAKSKTSNHKRSKNYKKLYKGQGR